MKYKRFFTLGVKTDGTQVYTLSGRGLGPLVGARAELGEPTRHHRVAGSLAATVVTAPALGPLALLGIVSKKSKSIAFVVFTNGTVHQKNLDGNTAIRSAQSEVMQFNAIAAVGTGSSASRPENLPETPLRLACGHVAFVTDSNIVRWLRADGEKAYYCRVCEADQAITATGPDALLAQGSSSPLTRPAQITSDERGTPDGLVRQSYDGSEPLDQALRTLDFRHELDFGKGITVALNLRQPGFIVMENGKVCDAAEDPLEVARKVVSKLTLL